MHENPTLTATELLADIRRGLKDARIRTATTTRGIVDTKDIMRHDLKRAITLTHRKASGAQSEEMLEILAGELEHNRKELNWPDDSKSLHRLVISTLKHGAIAGELKDRFPAVPEETLRDAMYKKDNPALFLEVQGTRMGQAAAVANGGGTHVTRLAGENTISAVNTESLTEAMRRFAQQRRASREI